MSLESSAPQNEIVVILKIYLFWEGSLKRALPKGERPSQRREGETLALWNTVIPDHQLLLRIAHPSGVLFAPSRRAFGVLF
jgi:hypothetical protein